MIRHRKYLLSNLQGNSRHNWRNQSQVNKKFESAGANRFKMEENLNKSIGDEYTPETLSAHELFINMGKLGSSPDPALIEGYMNRMINLCDANEISAKDFALLINSLSKISPSCKQVISELKRMLRRNHKFAKSFGPIDISLTLTALARCSKADPTCKSDSLSVAKRICDEIPLRISLFENHQLGQLLHALSSLQYIDEAVIIEIVKEIELSRDLNAFNPQSVIVIASSISRLQPVSPKHSQLLEGLWESIQMRVFDFKRNEIQPNWPDVLLTSIAHSGLPRNFMQEGVMNKLVKEMEYQFQKGLISQQRVSKTIDALDRIGFQIPKDIRLKIK